MSAQVEWRCPSTPSCGHDLHAHLCFRTGTHPNIGSCPRGCHAPRKERRSRPRPTEDGRGEDCGCNYRVTNIATGEGRTIGLTPLPFLAGPPRPPARWIAGTEMFRCEAGGHPLVYYARSTGAGAWTCPACERDTYARVAGIRSKTISTLAEGIATAAAREKDLEGRLGEEQKLRLALEDAHRKTAKQYVDEHALVGCLELKLAEISVELGARVLGNPVEQRLSEEVRCHLETSRQLTERGQELASIRRLWSREKELHAATTKTAMSLGAAKLKAEEELARFRDVVLKHREALQHAQWSAKARNAAVTLLKEWLDLADHLGLSTNWHRERTRACLAALEGKGTPPL